MPGRGEALLDQTVVARVISGAMRPGVDFAEVFVEDKRAANAHLDDGKVEQLSSGRDRGAGIRVTSGDTTGFAHTSDLTEAGLAAAAEAAAAAARSGGGGVREIDLTPFTPNRITNAEILPESVSKTRKIELLQAANDAARSTGDAIKQVSVGYGDVRRRILVANSDGVFVEDDQVRTRFVVQCVALGDGGMQTSFDAIGHTMGFEMFDRYDVEQFGRDVAQVALTKLRARPSPTGELPVILKHGAGGVLFHEACGHGLEADLVGKQASAFAGRVGEQVASPLVTLVDDGTMGPEWGAFSVDDEGHVAKRNVLIQDGVLTDYMWDYLRARKEGHEYSGNGRRQSYQHLPMVRMTNTFLTNGNTEPDDIVRQTKHGVYVSQLTGGQVNTATGDFVFGVGEAYMVENGEITEPLRDANLIGNGPDVLKNIDVIGNDFAFGWPGMCGKDGQTVFVGQGQPTLRVAVGLTVGGTAA
jgi:TldD protein